MPKEPKTPLDHVRTMLDVVHDWQSEQGITDATMLATLVEAQIVVSVEQIKQQARTADALELANMIAVYNMAEENCQALTVQAELTIEAWGTLSKTIAARLGLA